MNNSVLYFLKEERGITFDWHINQVLNWLKFDNGRNLDNVLIYSSLELRCAIERYIFEFLILLKDGKLTLDEERKCRSIDGLFSLMKETDPFYRKTAEYTKLIISTAPYLPDITIVDFSYLRRKWEELSEYCHKKLKPEESFLSPGREFQKKGFKIIEDVISRFSDWRFESVCGVILPETMPNEVRDIYDKYVKDEINQDQAKRMLCLIEPILRERFLRSK